MVCIMPRRIYMCCLDTPIIAISAAGVMMYQVKRNLSVQIGRVCLVNRGPDSGKICTILDIVDQNRV